MSILKNGNIPNQNGTSILKLNPPNNGEIAPQNDTELNESPELLEQIPVNLR